MSFTDFRNSYMTEAENRLAAVDISTATTSDFLLQGAIYKMAAAVASADLLGPLSLTYLAGMTGATLNTWLQDPSNNSSFQTILSSSTAMAAVIASSTAMAAVIASSSAMAAVAASSTAMAAVIASSSAMAAVAASSTAMAAVNASDAALNALYASPLVQKFTYAGGSWSANPQVIRNGAGLFVRLTQINNAAGFSDNYCTSHYLQFDGVNVAICSTNAGLPYNFTQVSAKFGRQPAKKFLSSLAFYDYNQIEIAYIPM